MQKQFVTSAAGASASSNILGSASRVQVAYFCAKKAIAEIYIDRWSKKQKPEEVEMKGQPSEGSEGSED